MSGRVLITGASSGIGRALALEFASRGYDLVLVARDEARLKEVAGQCRTAVTVIAEDLTDPSAVDRVESRLPGPISVLVNNAGYTVHGDFSSTDLEKELALVNLQIGALIRLTKAVLPEMRRRKEGKFLNVSSVYAVSPVPFQAVYSACKSFLLSFSQALADEVRADGITVTVLCPGITRTEFRSRAGVSSKKSMSGMAPEKVAALGVASCLRGDAIATPGFVNRLFMAVVRHLPAGAVPRLLRLINTVRGVNKLTA